MTGEPTVEEQALSLADEVLTLRARLRERDDELDRLRAENAEYRQMQKAYKAHMRAVKQVATPLRQLDPDDGTVDWGGRSPLLHLKDAVAALLKEADQ